MAYEDFFTDRKDVYIRATHQYGYRSGQWGKIIAVDYSKDKSCFVVLFVDGKQDLWPIYDSSDPYEFKDELK